MTFEYQIVEARESDAAEILRLQYAAYQSEAAIYHHSDIQPLTQTLEQTIDEFKESTVLKAVSNGKIIGSVRATEQEDGSVYIGKLMVLPYYQNKGIGKRLLRKIENEFPGRRYWLITGHKSEKNLKLYEKLGYTRFKTEETASWLTLVHLEKTANCLTNNLDKLHTTPMGSERIRRNLSLQIDEIVTWCKEAVRQADKIIRQGKNWYVYRGGVVITINVSSFTIITARRINSIESRSHHVY